LFFSYSPHYILVFIAYITYINVLFFIVLYLWWWDKLSKIIKIVHPFFGIAGGAEKVVLTLARRIADKYGSCEVHTSWFDHSKFDKYIKGTGIKLVTLRDKPYFNYFFGFKFNPFLVSDMIRLSKKIGGCDVLLATNWPANIATFLAKRRNKSIKKIVYHAFEVDSGLYHNLLFGKD